MNFTPEQEQELARQRAAQPSRSSFVFQATPSQKAYLENAEHEELARKPEMIRMSEQLDRLLCEDSIAGALRRAIDDCSDDWQELGLTTTVDHQRLQDFYLGQLELTQSELERLAAHFALHLVPVQL